jgi:hypothetical protein
MEGKKRCKLHGGASTGPKRPAIPTGNKNAAKPGSIYSQFLTDDERIASEGVDLDSLDAEIRLATIRLMRALRREQDKGDTPELDEQIEREGAENVTAKSESKYKVRDYSALIDRLTARVESLKAKRVDALLKRRADERAAELHALDVERKRKEASMTNGSTTNNIMPVPTADSVDSWEQVASEQQNKALGK